jgi:hypothetical protein
MPGYRRGPARSNADVVPRNRDATAFEPSRAGREVVGLIGQIQALVRELEALRRRGRREPELRAKERTLEKLRWRLATVARRAATESSHPGLGLGDRGGSS